MKFLFFCCSLAVFFRLDKKLRESIIAYEEKEERMKINIKKHSRNPILTPVLKEGSFEKTCVYNPGAAVKDGKVYLLYRAESRHENYISRIGLAISKDGFEFERYPRNPVIKEDKKLIIEKRGCEDPRVVKIDQGYFLTYGAYPGGEEMYLCGATSGDLIHWEKIGILVPGREKAGALVQNYKYKGKYVMYFGEGESLRVALSKDLKNWEVINDSVLSIREDYFDSYLVEGGPPPIITKDGILLIYNSARRMINYEGKRDWLSYAPGLAIFDKDDPTRLLHRLDSPILEPTEYWERYGRVNNVIFATGLVYLKSRWLLYYGGTDKSIGVATLYLDS